MCLYSHYIKSNIPALFFNCICTLQHVTLMIHHCKVLTMLILYSISLSLPKNLFMILHPHHSMSSSEH